VKGKKPGRGGNLLTGGEGGAMHCGTGGTRRMAARAGGCCATP